jgi:heat shock protein HspQ
VGVRQVRQAKFALGQIVKHRIHGFRGVIHDVDPEFANTEAWYQAIPKEVRPYEAYVSEQNLLPDAESGPVTHPMVERLFTGLSGDRYVGGRTLAN